MYVTIVNVLKWARADGLSMVSNLGIHEVV